MTQTHMDDTKTNNGIEAEIAAELAGASSDSESSEKEPALYEVAYHIVSTVAEGEVQDAEASVRKAIESHGGKIESVEVPKYIKLAYGITKLHEGKNRAFTEAYFGWMRATISPEAIANINEDLALNPLILRHLTIRLTKEEIAHPFTGYVGMRQKGAEPLQTTITQKPDIEKEEGAGKEVSEEELDKAIGDIAATVEGNEKDE